MSYYFGLLLKDLIILCTDRTAVRYPEKILTSDAPRYFRPFPNLMMCPTGYLPFAGIVASIMASLGCHGGVFDVQNLVKRKEEFKDSVNSSFLDAKRKNGKTGPSFNSDILFGGISPDGVKFISAISSEDNFELQICNQPGTYICLRHQPDILAHVSRQIEFYLEVTSAPIHLDIRKALAKKYFPKILHRISEKDFRVSRSGDLIFIDSSGYSVEEFGKGSDLKSPQGGIIRHEEASRMSSAYVSKSPYSDTG